MSNFKDFVAIGYSEEFVTELKAGKDACFGRFYIKSSPNCMACRAPCVMDEKIILMKEICAGRKGKMPGASKLKRLTSSEVLQRIEQGNSLSEIFREILNGAPVEYLGAQARELLVDRINYLKASGSPIIVEVPRYKDMV